jgi:two-component system, NarL family, invasion response regulator UvrY
MIRILITDDHPVVRKGIRQILEDDDKISLIHEASDGKELVDKLMALDYDVVLLDISLPGRSGLDLIPQIKKIRQKTAILIISIHSEELYAIQAIKSGASGYITKSSAPGELLSAIYKVSRGEKYVSSSLAERLADRFFKDEDKPLHIFLSAREMEVLELLGAGKTVSQIGNELSLSAKTVSTYRTRLLIKLNLKTTADLIRYALMEGIKNNSFKNHKSNPGR